MEKGIFCSVFLVVKNVSAGWLWRIFLILATTVIISALVQCYLSVKVLFKPQRADMNICCSCNESLNHRFSWLQIIQPLIIHHNRHELQRYSRISRCKSCISILTRPYARGPLLIQTCCFHCCFNFSLATLVIVII